eukprot:1021377-Rhodomonas_salina.1
MGSYESELKNDPDFCAVTATVHQIRTKIFEAHFGSSDLTRFGKWEGFPQNECQTDGGVRE